MNSDTSVTITWVAPADSGSEITGYTLAIRQSDGNTFTTESVNCSVSITSCTVPISVLLATPYTLVWGASIYVTVLATNAYGSSAASVAGNGAVIKTNPDPPVLSNNAAVTTATNISLRWDAPVFEGGSPITSYSVWWD